MYPGHGGAKGGSSSGRSSNGSSRGSKKPAVRASSSSAKRTAGSLRAASARSSAASSKNRLAHGSSKAGSYRGSSAARGKNRATSRPAAAQGVSRGKAASAGKTGKNPAVRASSADSRNSRNNASGKLISVSTSSKAFARSQSASGKAPSRKSQKASKAVGGGMSGGKPRKSAASSGKSGGRLKTKIILGAVAVVALFFAVDCLMGMGKIHSNVHVGDLDVGGMTIEEARSSIEKQYSGMGSNQTITMYANDDVAKAAASGASSTSSSSATTASNGSGTASSGSSTSDDVYKITFDYETMDKFNTDPPKATTFTVDSSAIGVGIDSEGLAQEAYNVGRGWDFVFGKIGATIFGRTLEPRLAFDDTYMDALTGMLTSSLGNKMVNPGIEFDGSAFTTTTGNDGYMVKAEDFEKLMSDALMGDTKSFTIPMGDVKMEVDDAAAQRAAEKAQEAVAQAVELKLDSSSWKLDTGKLGSLVSTYVDGRELVPYISLPKVQELVPTLDGIGNIGTPAKNVHFAYDGSTLTHTEAEKGIGPDYTWIAQRMNKIVFGSDDLVLKAGEVSEMDDGTGNASEADDETAASSVGTSRSQAEIEADDAARTVTIVLDVALPTLTYDEAHSMNLDAELIGSYSTDYSSATTGKATNIELLSDILTNTVIAPGQTFSINETAGECNAEKGFQEAGSIVNGEVSSEIGGGICQVATTVFNAVFNAGYPIVERHNHSTYMASYPDGLDAAISWPYLDLRFKNDTDNYLMLLVDHNGTEVTCSLWGISPGYTTDYAQLSWEKGEEYKTITRNDAEVASGTEYTKSSGKNGHTVEIQRNTYDKSGTRIREDVFKSVYSAQDEIIIKGTG